VLADRATGHGLTPGPGRFPCRREQPQRGHV
jgi:hypothetical protein